MDHISEILTAALKKHRPAKDICMTNIWDIWDQALESTNSSIGSSVALNAKPKAFKDGILMVDVSSSAWMHQLRFLKTGIIQNINQKLGKPLVKEIRFKIGKTIG